LFYNLIGAPPVPGSLQEALCILVFRYRQEQDFYTTLAGLQPDGSDEQQEAFKKFKAAKFPYIYKTAHDERERTKAILDRAFSMGPIRITPESQLSKEELEK
jgi:hypothetical protein